MKDLIKYRSVGVKISVGSFAQQVNTFLSWGRERRSSYVCCVNVHMTVEAWRSREFAVVVDQADAATPDGMPVLIGLRLFAGQGQERVAGNDLLPALLEGAARDGIRVYFYGGQAGTLEEIERKALERWPKLSIAGSTSPPFRPLTGAEMDSTAKEINASGAQIVLVSLGCPKQERWMAAMKGKVNAVMVGVGGAFLLFAGKDTRAPKWMRDLSLEWLYRLWLEPGRLWKRYLVTNSIFVYLFFKEVLLRVFRRVDRH